MKRLSSCIDALLSEALVRGRKKPPPFEIDLVLSVTMLKLVVTGGEEITKLDIEQVVEAVNELIMPETIDGLSWVDKSLIKRELEQFYAMMGEENLDFAQVLEDLSQRILVFFWDRIKRADNWPLQEESASDTNLFDLLTISLAEKLELHISMKQEGALKEIWVFGNELKFENLPKESTVNMSLRLTLMVN